MSEKGNADDVAMPDALDGCVAGPGIADLERLEQWAANVQPVPATRLLTGRPSPDREAMQVREVAALERSVDARFAAVAELLKWHAREVDDQGRHLSGVNAELTAQIERLAARVKKLEEA